ncbi:MAG: TrmH family RNA methyltransferase, partial [Aggregatilineales bacterium]
MTDFEHITSFQNSKIKLAQKLRDKRHRGREELFVIEYSRDLARALDRDYRVKFALFCPEYADSDDNALLNQIDVPVYQVTAALLDKASYRQNPGGLLAIMHTKPVKAADTLTQITSQHILGLEGLRKPGNIGALLRTADAAGFDTILLIDCPLDIYNPNIIRSSTGAVFLDNIYSLSSQDALSFLKDSGYAIISADPTGTHDLYGLNFSEKSALILGAEATGLSDLWQAN